MTVRPLDILDLPFLSRYRQDVLSLDSAHLLARGNPLGTTGFLSLLDPRRHLYTAVASENGNSLMGQMTWDDAGASARLTFLAPASNLNGMTLPLLDHLAQKAGEWGAQNVLAEVDEDSPAFKPLRQAGFSMFAWQKTWKLPGTSGRQSDPVWQPAEDRDWIMVQTLHAQIVPALLQAVDALPQVFDGFVCRKDGQVQGYVRAVSGPAGTWLMPLVPPDSNCAAEHMSNLVAAMTHGSRPVYLCVRSYQAWLETTLQDLGAAASGRQAVMVKRLARAVRETQAVPNLEKALAKVKPAAPVTRTTRSIAGEGNHNQ